VKRLLAGAGGVAIVALAVPAVASVASATTAPKCVTVHDHINKTDNGHGTPAEWADLSLKRTTKVCGDEKTGYTVYLFDRGSLRTIKGAGTPNGTGGQILNRVRGGVYGTYTLTATGGKFVNHHGDVSASSTEYVKSLFSDGTTVTGKDYAWAYATRCEKWLDSSANSDGQGAAAGNITGKLCGKPSHSPTPTPTSSATPTPTSSTSTPPGEAPVPTPVNSDLPVTG
jgi:hypothetical protein